MDRIELKTLFTDTAPYLEKEITVCGWVRTMRNSKSLSFIELNDGSCFQNLQVILEEAKVPNYEEIARQNVGGRSLHQGIHPADAPGQAAF